MGKQTCGRKSKLTDQRPGYTNSVVSGIDFLTYQLAK